MTGNGREKIIKWSMGNTRFPVDHFLMLTYNRIYMRYMQDICTRYMRGICTRDIYEIYTRYMRDICEIYERQIRGGTVNGIYTF
jgi:hypothetical protein